MFGKGAGIYELERTAPSTFEQTNGWSVNEVHQESLAHGAVLGKSIMPNVGLDGLADMLPSETCQPNHDARVFWRQDMSC